MTSPQPVEPLASSSDESRVRRRPLVGGAEALAGLECQAVRETDFVLLGSRIVGVSPDGLVIESVEPVKAGESVLLTLRIPATGEWVDADGTVEDVSDPSGDCRARAVSIRIGSINGSSAAVVSLLAALEDAESVLL